MRERTIDEIRAEVNAIPLEDVRFLKGDITRGEIAELLGLRSEFYVWRWETRRAAPSPSACAKLQIWSEGKVTRLSFMGDEALRKVYNEVKEGSAWLL